MVTQCAMGINGSTAIVVPQSMTLLTQTQPATTTLHSSWYPSTILRKTTKNVTHRAYIGQGQDF